MAVFSSLKPNLSQPTTKTSSAQLKPVAPKPAPTPTNYSANFVGPVKPGQTIGGVNPLGQKLPAPAPTVNTGGGGGGTSGGGSGYSGGGGGLDLGGVLQQQPSQSNIDFDALIAPALQALDEQIAPLQQSTATDIQGIQTRGASQTAQAQTEFAGQQNAIGQAKTDQAQMGEDAASEARRQFAEIQQGLQSRYGGTTGTGQFANEIAGSQTLRNIANIRTGVARSIGALDEKLAQVKEIGRIALQDIEDQTTEQISKAKNNLETQLAGIRQQKGELQARKAELAANAIQFYQQTVNQVNASNAQFKQQLFMQQQQAENQLSVAKQKASSIVANAKATSSGSSIMNTPVGNSNIGQVNPAGGGAQGSIPLDEYSKSLLQAMGVKS